MEDECIRCGKCCHFIIEGKLTMRFCQYMVKYLDNLCVIYNNKDRIGSLSGKVGDLKFHCNLRKDTPFDYEGCPLNSGKKIVKENMKVCLSS